MLIACFVWGCNLKKNQLVNIRLEWVFWQNPAMASLKIVISTTNFNCDGLGVAVSQWLCVWNKNCWIMRTGGILFTNATAVVPLPDIRDWNLNIDLNLQVKMFSFGRSSQQIKHVINVLCKDVRIEISDGTAGAMVDGPKKCLESRSLCYSCRAFSVLDMFQVWTS